MLKLESPIRAIDEAQAIEDELRAGADISLQEMASRLGVTPQFLAICAAVDAVLARGEIITLYPADYSGQAVN